MRARRGAREGAAQVWLISLLFAVKKQPTDKPLPQESKHVDRPDNEITVKNLLTMFGGLTMPAYFFRSELGAAELRRLARRESGRVCQRVLMIANLLEGMEHEEAARLTGLSRSAAYEWHNRYEEEGIEGLRDRPRPGRQPRVDAVTSARFKERIVAGAELQRDGVVAFRAVDAQRILKEEFELDCSLSSTYRLLHRIKLSWLAPRPRHPQADATAQAEFSQHLDCN